MKDFNKEIRKKQGEYDLMSKSLLADEVGMPRTTLTKRLSDPMTMTFGEFKKLNAAVRPNPVAVLALLGYSLKDLKKAIERPETQTV